jgi:hypothetical protein
MAAARPAYLPPEDRELMTKDEDLHLVGSPGNDSLIWIWPTFRDGNDPEPVVGPVILTGM